MQFLILLSTVSYFIVLHRLAATVVMSAFAIAISFITAISSGIAAFVGLISLHDRQDYLGRRTGCYKEYGNLCINSIQFQ